MKIELKNLIFKFNNISIKDCIKNLKVNKYIIINNNIKNSNFLFEKNIKYDDFLNILKNSLDIYIDTTNYDQVLEECFNYFKITTNQIVKRNMVQKIAYIVIESIQNNDENIIIKLKKLLNSYLDKKTNSFNTCNELIFLKIIANLETIEEISHNIFCSEEEHFCLLDFILDLDY